jgi:integrase
MKGSIRERGDSYQIRISLGKDPQTGKYSTYSETVSGPKREAEKRLRAILTEIDKGSFIEPGKVILKDYLSQWLRDYVKANLSAKTYERYESIVRVHLVPSLGHIQLFKLRPDHIQKLYGAKLNDGLAARSVLYIHRILHKSFETALKWGLLSRNILDGVDTPKSKRNEMQIWDANEVNRFLETAKNSQYYTLFFTALYTGARRSELLALRWSDVDLLLCTMSINRGLHYINKQYIFTEPKSAKSRRVIALSPDSVKVLRDHYDEQAMEKAMVDIKIQESDLIFTTYDNKPLRPNTVSRAWANITKQAGVRVIRFHDARHTHASLMLKQGIHPKIVQERLGHSTIATTLDIYSHVAPGMQEAAAQRFDDILKVGYNENTV